jgi:subtilisin family serine protease
MSVAPRRAAAGLALGLLLASGLLPGLVASPAGAAAAAGCDPATPVLIDVPSAALQQVDPATANARATGKGVVVAVVDSGVDQGNPHLRDAVLPGKSFVTGDKDPLGWTDGYGHGTAVAGIIAARSVPKSALVGLAPEAKILPVRVYVATQAGPQVTAADLPRLDRIAAGIRWAAEQGADIINVSISAPKPDAALAAAVVFAQQKGALVVASGGNRVDQGATTSTEQLPDGPRYPAALDGVLGVTAADGHGQIGTDSVHGSHIDLAGPGSSVLAPFFGGDCVLAADVPSTSFATGFVSAAAALLADRYPDEPAADLVRRLEQTATLAATGARTDAVGWGLIRPAAALALVLAQPQQSAVTAAAPAAVTSVDGVSLVTSEVAAEDPRQDSKDAAVLWLVAGAAGVGLFLVFGVIARGRAPVRSTGRP